MQQAQRALTGFLQIAHQDTIFSNINMLQVMLEFEVLDQ